MCVQKLFFCSIEESKCPCITIIFNFSSFICKLSYHCIGSYRLLSLQVESNLAYNLAVINWQVPHHLNGPKRSETVQ